MTSDIRYGRYQDVLADVECDTVIVDPPYGAKVHEAVNDENAEANGYAAPIAYAHWTPRDVEQFVDSWAPRTRRWLVAMTSHDLVPHWLSSYEVNGFYAFAPVNAVISGMGVRQLGDGPASWVIHIVVARRRAKKLTTVPGAKPLWRSLPGGYTGPATPGMAGGRGKPAWLIEALVRDYSDPGMTVCDPCAGWGSTLIAARKLRGLDPRPRENQGGLFDSLTPESAA